MNLRYDNSKGDILIVDDELSNLQFLFRVLADNGYEVRGAPNGSTALVMIGHQPPDLILLDINMPDMDGYKVCWELKANAKTHKIPVIFTGVFKDTAVKDKSFKAGGADYISKPFHIQEVLARVKAHLALRNQDENRSHRCE